jgi:hypothetical protein
MALRTGELPLHLAIEIEAPGVLMDAWDHGGRESIVDLVEIRMHTDARALLLELKTLCRKADVLDNDARDLLDAAESYLELALEEVGDSMDAFYEIASEDANTVVSNLTFRLGNDHVFARLRRDGPPSLTRIMASVEGDAARRALACR